EGGKGMTDLAQAVVRVVEKNETKFELLYELEQPIEKKVEIIAKEIYRANGVKYSEAAKTALRRIHNLGLDHLPVCIAKTQYSFSDDPAKLGAAKDFDITVNDIEIAAGAGFVVPILGKMMRMPGLPEIPASEAMDIDANGVVTGLN
ncbi:MAG: formate--tetrahydrofolate ligase, partial [Bacteroidetes bacterium]|nr:formate--tetrahydrofolate ligase [Bacteroidota bacterium]